MHAADYTSPDFSSAALITIDTQRDTLDGQPFEIPGTSAILPAMAALVREFRALGKPIIHVVRTSIYEASERDFKIIVVEDAISGLYRRGREELRGIGVEIARAEDLITMRS